MSGIFGAILKKDCSETLFYGTDYHSHLGSKFGGMAVYGKELKRRIHDISQGQFKNRFYLDYKRMRGNKGLGVISTGNPQPICLSSKFGAFCIVSSGLVTNSKQ